MAIGLLWTNIQFILNTFCKPIKFHKVFKKVREFTCVVYKALKTSHFGWFFCVCSGAGRRSRYPIPTKFGPLRQNSYIYTENLNSLVCANYSY